MFKIFEKLGVIWDEVFLFYFEYGVVSYYILVFSEVFFNLFCFDGVCYGYCFLNVIILEEFYIKICFEGFGDEVKCCIMFGIYVLSFGYYDVYYKKV